MASDDSSLRFSEMSSPDMLVAVQRKEKKDLIARTQKMKHSIPKGDKKKKKEVTAEISQLLSDLDLKHETEMKELLCLLANSEDSAEKCDSSDLLKQNTDVDLSKEVTEHLEHASESSLANEDSNKSSQKMSKAQKRRNKKAALEKERNKAIAEQDLENLHGLRHLESEAIKKKLSERKLTIHEVASDGNCLYKAIEHQLSVLKLPLKTVQCLREETSKYMLSHAEDYMPFLTSLETGDALNEEMYMEYCEDIVKTSAWGGHIEIQVLSHILDVPIEIIQADGTNIIVGEEKNNPKLILSYHRHVFGLGEHYNSVIPVGG